MLFINLMMAIISFKQFFWKGNEVELLQLQSITLIPFFYAYSIMVVLFITFLFQKNDKFFVKIFKFLIIVLLALTPLQFLKYKNTWEIITLPFFLAFFEILSRDGFGKQLELLIVTFVLLFISGTISKLMKIENSQPYFYGVFYYLYISWKCLKELKLKEVGIWNRQNTL